MLIITGDTHSDYTRFSSKNFPAGKELNRNDYIIICGDFGLWHDTEEERYWLDWLNNKPWTTLFVTGNHDNYDRLKEMPVEEWNGGKVQYIRPNIIHLMRGQYFNIDGKTFFTFGGARCHDIQDGVLDPYDPEFESKYFVLYRNPYSMFRINHYSWWKEEEPSKEEMKEGLKNLSLHNNEVDYIITHEIPTSDLHLLYDRFGGTEIYELTDYLEKIRQEVKFKEWFAGHHHINQKLPSGVHILYEDMIEVKDNIYNDN